MKVITDNGALLRFIAARTRGESHQTLMRLKVAAEVERDAQPRRRAAPPSRADRGRNVVDLDLDFARARRASRERLKQSWESAPY
jgi:hypothetical protein